MRLDGALEPRHGAATLQGRFIGVAKYRRETRVKCEQQQQQCADEDDEAAASGAAAAAVETSSSAAAAATETETETETAEAPATAKGANNNNSNNSDCDNQSKHNSNNCRWEASEQQARHLSPSQAPSIITTTTATETNKINLHLRIKGVATATATSTTTTTTTCRATAATLKMREEQSLMLMDPRIEVGGMKMNIRRLHTYVLCLISVVALLPPLALADDGDNFFAVNSFSVGPETTTPEFDYASRGQKKFGDKCENTLECGFPGSICDPKKRSCQCTEDLHVTNHFDKCGKPAAINESCFFNEQCEAIYFQTECRDGRCICRFDMLPIWGKDGSVDCQGRSDKRGPERYIDPAMIGVLVGMALMFIIICVVLRLFSQ